MDKCQDGGKFSYGNKTQFLKAGVFFFKHFAYIILERMKQDRGKRVQANCFKSSQIVETIFCGWESNPGSEGS